jgi:uncharacterized membrane protein
MMPTIQTLAELLSAVIELAGIVAIAVGGVIATAGFARALLRGHLFRSAYHQYRRGLGRSILLGLEFLVAADIIRTVTVDMSLESLAALGLLIVLRTFLSITIEVETEGQWPWDRGRRRELEEDEARETQGASG